MADNTKIPVLHYDPLVDMGVQRALIWQWGFMQGSAHCWITVLIWQVSSSPCDSWGK